MGMDPIRNLRLNRLANGLPGVTRALGAMHAEACMVCFEDQGHLSGVELKVVGSFQATFRVSWDGSVTEQLRLAWNDEPYTTEQAAYGIAFLLILELTEFTVIQKSRKSTGFDYWLGYEDNLFQNAARLEVSGIRRADDDEIRSRVKQKLKQTHPSDVSNMPAYVVVVEFRTPISHVVKK